MSNTIAGTKKSGFSSSTTIPSGSYFDFVSGNQNYRIKDTDLFSAIGFTGSIDQVGNPLGVPVLDQQGSKNLIRNLKAGFGMKVSLDNYNGVEIATNFSFDQTGEQLVDDPTAESPEFKSLVSGDGVTLTGATDTITIAVDTDGFQPANRVIINQASDFPNAVGGSIPLAANTEYYIGAKITVDAPFSLSGDTIVSGQPYISQITYNGSGSLFSGADAGALVVKNLSINSPSADLLNITNTTALSVVNVINCVIVDANSLGSISNIVGIVFDTCSMLNLDDGFTDAGTSTSVFSLSKVSMTTTNASFKAIDLGSNVYDSLEISNLQVNGVSGAIGISGLASSGNVETGQIASVQSCEFLGGMTALENITNDDIRYKFVANGSIPDTYPDLLLSLHDNTTETVISTVDTPVLAAGTWTVERTSQFTGTTVGRATYDGERDIPAPITISCTIDPASGTNKDITAYAAKNGTVIDNSKIKARVDSGYPIALTVVWQESLSEDDYIELFVENNTDTVNITVTDAVMRIL